MLSKARFLRRVEASMFPAAHHLSEREHSHHQNRKPGAIARLTYCSCPYKLLNAFLISSAVAAGGDIFSALFKCVDAFVLSSSLLYTMPK
jgi:hypothetical protein